MEAIGVGRLPHLSAFERYGRRRIAFWWMVGITIVSGTALALKKPTMYLESYEPLGFNAFPALSASFGAFATFVVTFTTLTGLLALVFKVPAVLMLGPWLERRLRGDVRRVQLRDVFHPGIRKAAFWGGSLQALYQMGVIGLITYLSPSAISAAKACVIIPLAFLEIRAGLLVPSGLRWWLRLATSITFTLAGASIVIFEGGFKLFKASGALPMIGLILLAVVGNTLLAKAEMHEQDGVNDVKAAAPVYSLARIVAYVGTCLTMLLVVGVVLGHAGAVWESVLLCIDRWWLVLPVAILGAISDTSRICIKVLITATYMYTMLAMSVVVDIVLQIPLKINYSDIYDNIHPGAHTVYSTSAGAALLIIGIAMHPRIRGQDLLHHPVRM